MLCDYCAGIVDIPSLEECCLKVSICIKSDTETCQLVSTFSSGVEYTITQCRIHAVCVDCLIRILEVVESLKEDIESLLNNRLQLSYVQGAEVRVKSSATHSVRVMIDRGEK